MPIVFKSEILRGFLINEELVCIKCVQDHERAPGKIVDAVISTDVIERDYELSYYCDRCGELL